MLFTLELFFLVQENSNNIIVRCQFQVISVYISIFHWEHACHVYLTRVVNYTKVREKKTMYYLEMCPDIPKYNYNILTDKMMGIKLSDQA